MDFTNKTVLVTGSTRHTGLGIAKAFLKAGARAGINSANPEKVAGTLAALKAEGFNTAFDATANIADEAQVEALFERLGNIDLLVNIALDGGVDAQLYPKDCEI